MGTAPDERQSADVPDYDQLVTDLVSALGKMGRSEPEALGNIARACGYLMRLAFKPGTEAWQTAQSVLDIAITRLLVPRPSTYVHTGDEHADGTGSRTGNVTQYPALPADGQ